MKAKHSTIGIKRAQEDLRVLRHNFIIQHVPRLHGLLMLLFPRLIPWFNYSIAEDDKDPTKLTLLRGSGKNAKVVAMNFLPRRPEG